MRSSDSLRCYCCFRFQSAVEFVPIVIYVRANGFREDWCILRNHYKGLIKTSFVIRWFRSKWIELYLFCLNILKLFLKWSVLTDTIAFLLPSWQFTLPHNTIELKVMSFEVLRLNGLDLQRCLLFLLWQI